MCLRGIRETFSLPVTIHPCNTVPQKDQRLLPQGLPCLGQRAKGSRSHGWLFQALPSANLCAPGQELYLVQSSGRLTASTTAEYAHSQRPMSLPPGRRPKHHVQRLIKDVLESSER